MHPAAICYMAQVPVLPYLLKHLGAANNTSYGVMQTVFNAVQFVGGLISGQRLLSVYAASQPMPSHTPPPPQPLLLLLLLLLHSVADDTPAKHGCCSRTSSSRRGRPCLVQRTGQQNII